MSILPPPSQPSTSRLAASSRPASSASERKSSSSTPKARKRGPVQPGSGGFNDDRRSTTQEPARESSWKGKAVDRRATAPLTSHLASIKPHAPSSSPPPPKRPRSPTVAIPSSRSAKRAQPSMPLDLEPQPKFALADCLDAFLPSRLLVSEYEKYGNPSYTQGKGGDRRFFKADSFAAPPTGPPPSWAGGDVGKLGTALTTSARLVPEIWGRDLVGTGPDGQHTGGVRAVNIQGIDMYLVGEEFPARSVALVGILVGVEDKTEKIIYHLDDSTAVVQCSCPRDQPTSVNPHDRPKVKDPQHEDEMIFDPTPPVSKEPRPHQDVFEVGALVRIVGHIVPGAYVGADVGLWVASMVELVDPNLESQHHLVVAQLHLEVYSRPFDLDGVLRIVRLEEREVEKAWDGQSQASSEAGSPRKKRIALPNPLDLSSAALHLPNFIVYIKHHLLRHNVATPALSAPSSPTGFNFAASDAVALAQPTPFTLAELESSRTLVKFANRLAAKLARDKVRDKAAAKKRLPVLRPKRWVANAPGQSGSARIMDAPVAAKGKGRERAETPPPGVDLAIEAQKQFCEALKQMRRMGEIVVLDSSEVVDLPDVGLSPLKEWNMTLDYSCDRSRPASSSADFEFNYAPASSNLGVRPAQADLMGDFNYAPASPVRVEHPTPTFDFKFAPADTADLPIRPTEVTYDPTADFNYAPESDDDVRPPAPSHSRSSFLQDSAESTTPRQPPPSLRPDAPSTPTTLRASRVQALQSPTRPSVSCALRTNSLPRSPGAESCTTSVYGFTTAEDSYQLVTPALLAPILLRFLTSDPKRDGHDESALRTKLLRADDKWAAVARESTEVSQALKLLVEREDVREAKGRYSAVVRNLSYGR